jgi:hypothetical protein
MLFVLYLFAEGWATQALAERPHRGIELRVPDGANPLAPVDEVPRAQRRDLLGGLVHEYHAVVA